MPEMVRRFRSFDAKLVREDGPTPESPKRNVIRMTASTSEPVKWGDWSEVLEHGEKSANTSNTRSLLLNHRAGMICGAVRSVRMDGKQSEVEAEILPDARMESGVLVSDAVESGALRGVSIGYSYDRADTDWDDNSRTLTVRQWRMDEVTLTALPADAGASVRELPAGVNTRSKEQPMPDPTDAAKAAADKVTAEREAAVKLAREEAVALTKDITVLARSHKLEAEPFLDMTREQANAAILKAISERNAKDFKDPESHAVPSQLTYDQADKLRDAVADAFVANAFGKPGAAGGNPVAARSLREIGVKYARASGIRGVNNWEREDAAHFILGENHMIRDRGIREAANITSSNFTAFTMLNAMTKVVVKGFEMAAENCIYPRIVATQTVPDFKTFTFGVLGTGNMTQVPENMAMPELIKTEFGLGDTVKFWGGTLSLTLQALVNDDTGMFERSLRAAGNVVQKTIEKRCIQRLLMGTSTSSDTSTWTSNTTSGGSLVYSTADLLAAARGKLGLVRAALINKVGLDGNPTGNVPKLLVCGPTNEQNAAGILMAAPGQTVANLASLGGLQIISTPFLELSSLTGNSTTSYYLGTDPQEGTGLVLSSLAGFENPTVQEYDAGSTGSRKWKFYKPFEISLVSGANTAGTTVIPAWQQGTT